MRLVNASIAILTTLTLVGCGEQSVETGPQDGIDDAFYAGGKADGLGIPTPIARTAVLAANLYDKDALHDAGISYRTAHHVLKYRAGDDQIPGTEDDRKIRDLAELDAVPYFGKGSMNALLEHIEDNNLVESTEFWDQIQPASYSAIESKRRVFGGPSKYSNFKVNFNATPGDVYQLELSRTDGTGYNPRLKVWSIEEGREWYDSPYDYATAQLEPSELLQVNYRVDIMNREVGGLYRFEITCLAGPCLELPSHDQWAFLWEGDLKGIELDVTEAQDWRTGSGTDPDTETDPITETDPDTGTDPEPEPIDPNLIVPAQVEPEEAELRVQLQSDFQTNYQWMGYTTARRHLFGSLHNEKGLVEGVYSGESIETWGIPDHTYMNTEHTWPKSRGDASVETDLHHLFPTRSHLNHIRSNHFFCAVTQVAGTDRGSSWGQSASGRECFEPRDAHKGNAARAIFYIAATRGFPMDVDEEQLLKQWNLLDPVDEAERARNDAIQLLQGNRNAFIDDATLVELAF